MTAKRLFFVLLALIGLILIGMVGGAYEINSLLSAQSNKLVALKAKSEALDQEQISLVKAKDDIKKYSGLEQITSSVVPQDKDQAETVRELVNLAAANNITLGSITFPASTLGGTAIISSATTPTAAAPVSSASSAQSKLSQLIPVKNIPGVYQLTITVQSDPNNPALYDNFINFLSDLEHNRRTSQVSTITLTPDIKNPKNLSFTLTLEVYIKP